MATVVANCTGQLPGSHDQGEDMYVKPKLERFGTLRDLTLVGLDNNCDGGIFGIGVTDGSWWACDDRNRS